ncbi:MAG: glycosyltransferase family 4 protein [Parachlamydiales bacterium]|jgi:glycosyltransferase involved in cell wall biosynthesis
MRILHLESSPGWGGQEMRLLKEAKGLEARGHRVFLGVIESGALIEKARSQALEVFELKLKKYQIFQALGQIKKIIQTKKIDLVVTHSSLDAWIGGIAARILKKPVVRLRHLSTPIKGGLNGFLLYRKLSDFVITTSEEAQRQVLKKAHQKKCLEIPTGVEKSFLKVNREKIKKFREWLGVGEKDFLVGTACFMRSWKGIDDFLKAAELLKDCAEIKWVIIGGGHMEGYVQKALERNLKNVVFTGYLEKPNFAIAALDLFMLLSTAHEGVPQALLQAAALKKPLIGTMTGGIPEVCQNQVTGLVVPRFAPEEVARAVLKLKTQRALAKKLGEEAFRLVKSKFTLERMLDQMETIYKRVSGTMV